MGIKYLNRFLAEHCNKSSISKKNISTLNGKTIVVDTSIYMYKFIAEGTLLENMYSLISIFKENNITLIFIFDGKSPPEKQTILLERKLLKQQAEQKFKHLKAELETNQELDNTQKNEMNQEMNALKKQFIHIKNNDIRKVKELMDAYGVAHYDAPGEADKICAYMVESGKAWGCLSDDMDMFAYGCKRVLRHMSLIHHTVIVYDLDDILRDLKMSTDDFRKILIISGTDYNSTENTSLYETMKWYKQFKLYIDRTANMNSSRDTFRIDQFYEWLLKTTKYINNYNTLLFTLNMFTVDLNAVDSDRYDVSMIPQKTIDHTKLELLLKDDGFVFLANGFGASQNR